MMEVSIDSDSESNRPATSQQRGPRKKTLVETLQCPVCDELPVPPVFGCQNGHIICNSCKDHVQHCAVCRAEKFNVRNVIAEDILTSEVLPCPFKSEGCRVPNMNGVNYTAHVKICDHRPIECHCKLGEEECHGEESFSKDEYLEHMMDYHGSRPGRSVHLVKCDMVGPFVPTYFSYLDRQFMLMSCKEGTKFWTWVTIDEGGQSGPGHHSRIQFYIKLTLRYYSARRELTFPSEMISPLSLRDTPKQVLKSGHCLEFSADTAPPTMPPYVWPGYIEEDGEEGGFVWGYDVEIHQAQDRNRFRSASDRRVYARYRTKAIPQNQAPQANNVPPPPNNQNPAIAQNGPDAELLRQMDLQLANLLNYDLNEFLPEIGVLDGIPAVDPVPPVVGGVPVAVALENQEVPVNIDPAVVPENGNNNESLSDDEEEDDDENDDDDDDDDEEELDDMDVDPNNTTERGTIRPASPSGNQDPPPNKISREDQPVGDQDLENDDEIVEIDNNSIHQAAEIVELDNEPTN